MCEQTEIDYLDGDIVWVKLGTCWWPGQVTGFSNLPDDIQREFQKKPLIAAVKFFQEDTYEYVKNYQQIYKYNCTLKDEFIKKGLDKYRSKSKDGASYMDKFPGDVEMAEKLTGGDPDILNSGKFCPEEKPDISGLFGEKKLPKKKRDRDEHMHRRSDGSDIVRKITHPRFLRESDHEVRIRHQPSSLPSTPNSVSSPQYSCHLCNFTSSRVNVIICHIKSHRSGNTPMARSKVKTYSQSRRSSDTDTPKRKYVRKEKTHVSRSEGRAESGKRKQTKQVEKASKKKKTDPGLREILADWEDESEDEMSLDQSGSLTKDSMDDSKERDEKESIDTPDTNEIMAETEKLLKETEKLSTIYTMDDSLGGNVRNSKNSESETDTISEDKVSKTENAKSDSVNKSQKDLSDNEKKRGSEKDDKKSRLSCFDFDEDDLPEPSIPPVRKIPRVFGEKNLSLKKEIIKEFEMSQALKNEQERESDNDKADETKEIEIEMSANKIAEVIGQDIVNWDKKNKTVDENSVKNEIRSEKYVEEVLPSETDNTKPNSATCETEVEIVEILEVEREEGEEERMTTVNKTVEKEISNENAENVVVDKLETIKDSEQKDTEMKSIEMEKSSSNNVIAESATTGSSDNASTKELEETLSEQLTTETEDETVSESADTLPEQSENSDADMLDRDTMRLGTPNISQEKKSEQPVKRKRGRPRKSLGSMNNSRKSTPTRKMPEKKEKRDLEMLKTERKTSESDTERSHSGRRRKPNKKYLESDIYIRDPEESFKTDDSLSESDDKLLDKLKPKRRGRLSGSKKNVEVKSNDQIVERELELSDQLLDSNEDNSKMELEHEIFESKIGKGKLFTGLEKKLVSDQTSTVSEESVKPIETSPPVVSTEKDLRSEAAKLLMTEDVFTKLMKEESLKSDEASVVKTETDKNGIVEENKEPKDSTLPSSSSEVSTEETESNRQSEITKTVVEMLPPKKSQIKKFELSQIDFFETETANKPAIEIDAGLSGKLEEMEVETPKIEEEKKVEPQVREDKTGTECVKILKSPNLEQKEEQIQEPQTEAAAPAENVQQRIECQLIEEKQPDTKAELKTENVEQISKDATKSSDQTTSAKRSSMQTRYKGKFTPETGSKAKKEKELLAEEKPINTFQEAFLKTLQIDKKTADEIEVTTGKGKKGKKVVIKRKTDDQDHSNVTPTISQEIKIENVTEQLDIKNIPNVEVQENLADMTIMSNFEGIEVVVEGNVEIETKSEDTLPSNQQKQLVLPSTDGQQLPGAPKKQTQASTSVDSSKATSTETQKPNESPKVSISTPSPTSDVSVPVKKREMPRIIENVTLTEPMQILKSKLLDKFPQKGVKHKLEDSSKKVDQKGSPKAKIMKVETISGNSKIRSHIKMNSPPLSLTKKVQVLKTEEAETSAMEAKSEKLNVQTTQTLTSTSSSSSEKCIQQSSQSLADMELDINSMPFVLSEDVLTPESIEQMPVVISSIIPASSTMPATLSFTPTTQMVTSNQAQFKLAAESTAETSPAKKKTGTPAILKNKSKAKPTITSIKTIVPPLTGGVKGLKFQSAQTGKTQPILTQKGTPGKYVVVQTAGGQQLRYSVQGKTATQQKIAIPASKSATNAQVVQQGGKVVILTSAQSGQAKMLPLNITKTLGNKVQRIMTSKAQVFCPISPQNIITSKTVIAPKTDASSPTTSKLTTSRQIINPQGLITSKGLLTPIQGTIAKTALLGTLPQGIITKGGLYTPISAASLGGKTIIGSKTLVTKGATILTSQSLGSSKAILTPVTQTVGGKIINTQGMVTTKGTILTPITGQQVKAIAAKSPSKGGKIQYQSIQQKAQLPMLQKSVKIPMSSAAQMRTQTSTKSAGGTLTIQNTSTSSKSTQHGKKTKTIVQQSPITQNLSSQQQSHSSSQQTINVISSPVQQKGKAMSTIQKVIIPHGNSRQTKAQQKIVVQKVPETPVSTVQSSQSKQTIASPSTSIPTVSRTTHHRHASSKSSLKTHTLNQNLQQKNLLNIAMNSVTTTTTASSSLPSSTSLPPLEPIETEKKAKIDSPVVETAQKEQTKTEKISSEKTNEPEKTEEPKVTTHPQIMALPTESSDGSQTYVLVTIDEQGQIQPLDNSALMSLEGSTQNPDGTRTLYIDPGSFGETGALDNIILQFDNGALSNVQSTATESNQTIISESFPTSEIIQTSNQDILAAALANTDFQQDISLPDNSAVMTTGLTQTSLINQTILQSTIIPPTEPISSPSVLETSLTLNQPIMTPLEVPSNLPIQTETTPTSVVPTIPSSLELPITITNPNISYISTGEAQIQIPGNSMPDIGEIIENPQEISQTEIPASTQYLVIPNLEEGITVEAQGTSSIPAVSYSVSIPNNIVLETSRVQTTPSMPIIDDTYADGVQFTASMPTSMEQSFVDVPVSEMLVSKAPVASTSSAQSQDITVTSEMTAVDSQSVPAPVEEAIVSSNETHTLPEGNILSSENVLNETRDVEMPLQVVYSSQEVPVTRELVLQQSIAKDNATSDTTISLQEEITNNDNVISTQTVEQVIEPMTSSMPIIDEALVTSDSNVKESTTDRVSIETSTDVNKMEASTSQEAEAIDKFDRLSLKKQQDDNVSVSATTEQPVTTGQAEAVQEKCVTEETMEVEEAVGTEIYAARTMKPEECQRDEPSSQGEVSSPRDNNLEINFEESNAEISNETPSQSYEQFDVSVASDSADLPSQSATKSENSREPTQSIPYEPMETDEETVMTEPPTQSFEHMKMSEPSQSYETSAEANTNAPTQSFNEIMQKQETRGSLDDSPCDDQSFPTQSYEVGKVDNLPSNLETDAEISGEILQKQEDRGSLDNSPCDDQSFPTQSYEIGKVDNLPETLETDAEISQEGNIPSQSNDIGADGIGTSSVSTNNSGLNEDETASSSYVPETPENQERDQDQESAISTSSYEIPPCEELNIASSSVIPDTSVRAEHTSIHDNGVPEIPTSSYNLNPDITSTHVDSVPTSSYEDQVIVEQNVSTSYEVPISMPGLEDTSSQNFVTESTDHRNEPTSYYAHHQEVTASYYESVDQESNSRIEEDPQEEVTPSYYERNPQEASQSYFTPEEATQSYSSHNMSPNYYDPRPEGEASQSYYSADDIEKSEQSSSQNIEASQSFYQERTDELRLRQQGEATPTYSERYPVDYTLENSPIDRHDLVESSVPATRPMER